MDGKWLDFLTSVDPLDESGGPLVPESARPFEFSDKTKKKV
jgi:hypothetical protein